MQTQTQKLTALPPADPLGVRFCEWFSHGYHWIYGATPAPGEKIQWRTENRYPLEPRNLWQEYQDPEKIIGLRFDNEATRYCMIDIDRGSPYHPASDRAKFNSVLAALETIGLCRPLLIRSSDSEGIHIYYFLPEPVHTFSLACAIRFALEDAGLSLRPGWLEIFPNTKAYSLDGPKDYMGHRLPLQAGSYWLDNDGLPISNDLGQFLDATNVASINQDMVALRKAITAAGRNHRRLRSTSNMSRGGASWKRHLEERIVQGWTGHHQTNNLLLDFARYGHVFLHLRDDALVDFVVMTAQASPGYEQYCRHQHEIRRRAADRSRGADNGFYVPYCGFPKRDRSYQENFGQPQNNIVKLENQANVTRRQQAAERIQQAMEHLKATSTLPYGATARATAIIATLEQLTGKGISHSTLYKDAHRSLWYPGQESPEPAQEATLHSTLEVNSIEKSPEPAQGETLHPTPLYEGVGANALHPEPPPRGAGVLQGIVPFEHSGEREGENVQTGTTGTTTPATSTAPATPAAPTAPTAPDAPATPAASTAPVNPATPTASDAPATPTASTAPVAPDAPATPAAPATLAAPDAPATPTAPTTLAAPATPTAPATSTAPATPAAPTAPTAPDAPATPAASTAPVNPATPTAPDAPATPTASTAPVAPDAPATPAASTAPAAPTTPTGIEQELEQKLEACRQIGCHAGQVWRNGQQEILVNGLFMSVESFMQRSLSSLKETLQPCEAGLNSCREAIASIKQKRVTARSSRLSASC